MYYKRFKSEERNQYVCLAPGLVDLFQDEAALNAGLNVGWVLKLLANPLPNSATVVEWREHFFKMMNPVGLKIA